MLRLIASGWQSLSTTEASHDFSTSMLEAEICLVSHVGQLLKHIAKSRIFWNVFDLHWCWSDSKHCVGIKREGSYLNKKAAIRLAAGNTILSRVVVLKSDQVSKEVPEEGQRGRCVNTTKDKARASVPHKKPQ